MENNIDWKTYNKARAKRVMKNLEKRYMKGYYFENPHDANKKICKMISEGDLVAMGGSETIIQTGLINELRRLDIRLLDRYKSGISKEVINEMRRKGLLSDVFITGTNALTLNGELVNQDGLGNRVASMIYGPKKVIVIAGMNKVVPTVDDAIRRIKDRAAPLDSIRIGLDTPCHHTGVCSKDLCFPPNRICSQLAIIESSIIKDRIHVFMIGKAYGY